MHLMKKPGSTCGYELFTHGVKYYYLLWFYQIKHNEERGKYSQLNIQQ